MTNSEIVLELLKMIQPLVGSACNSDKLCPNHTPEEYANVLASVYTETLFKIEQRFDEHYPQES